MRPFAPPGWVLDSAPARVPNAGDVAEAIGTKGAALRMQGMAGLFDLTGRVALVTGAGRGLGFEIARALAAAGAEVALNGRDGARVEAATARLGVAGLAARPAVFDVTDAGAISGWIESQPRPPDILVNNATARDRRPSLALAPEAVERLIAVNTMAAYNLTRALVPSMTARGWGRIINLTSIAGPRAGKGDAGYTLAKGGLEALTRAHAVEFAAEGVTVNAIAPGFFATEANATWVDDAEIQAYLAERSPLGRWARPGEIAGAAVFLASDAASYVNGHVLVVDGGMSIKM